MRRPRFRGSPAPLRTRSRSIGRPTAAREAFKPFDWSGYAERKPPTLSGGEQVLLALHCFSLSDYAAIGIDTALEQLDPDNRGHAIGYLAQGAHRVSARSLADNRLDPSGMAVHELTGTSPEFACDLAAAARPPACDPMPIKVARPLVPLSGRTRHLPQRRCHAGAGPGLSADRSERRRQDDILQAARGRARA